jgi:anti-sigma regulatory factor (Ser/Thr protein kinase)
MEKDSQSIQFHYEVPGDDFTRAGEASAAVKQTLKKLGFPPDMVRRAAITMYEAEINMVIHAGGGEIEISIHPDKMTAVIKDNGPGIPDVEKAMKEGWSTAPDTIRSLGFGAGMGLPNIKKYTDSFLIETAVGQGTAITLTVENHPM